MTVLEDLTLLNIRCHLWFHLISFVAVYTFASHRLYFIIGWYIPGFKLLLVLIRLLKLMDFIVNDGHVFIYYKARVSPSFFWIPILFFYDMQIHWWGVLIICANWASIFLKFAFAFYNHRGVSCCFFWSWCFWLLEWGFEIKLNHWVWKRIYRLCWSVLICFWKPNVYLRWFV